MNPNPAGGENQPRDGSDSRDQKPPVGGQIVQEYHDIGAYSPQDETRHQYERFTSAFEETAKAAKKTAAATEALKEVDDKIAAATIKSAEAAVASAKANRHMVWLSLGMLAVAAIQTAYTYTSIQLSTSALNASIEASRTDQRAWVGVKGGTVEKIQVGQPITIRVSVVNSGKSFALDVKTPNVIGGVLSTLTNDKIVEDATKEIGVFPYKTQDAAGAFAPGQEVFITCKSAPINQEQFDGIKSGGVVIFVFGEISYLDIFGKRHTTEFFAKHIPGTDTVKPQREHNNAN